jgi:hypothetical protein
MGEALWRSGTQEEGCTSHSFNHSFIYSSLSLAGASIHVNMTELSSCHLCVLHLACNLNQ